MLNRFRAAFQFGIGMFHFWLIFLSAKVVRILRLHRTGPTAETIQFGLSLLQSLQYGCGVAINHIEQHQRRPAG
jgi:hypothetical protein